MPRSQGESASKWRGSWWRRSDAARTGVTVVLPQGGKLFREKVPAAAFVANGFGKLTGVTQVEELGTLETPIALTGTLNTFRVADALVDWVLALPGNEDVLSVNPLVGECNDGTLSDIRRRPVGREQVLAALVGGAGTGRRRRGRRGHGHDRARLEGRHRHRLAPPARRPRGWTVGVLVQSNFGGALTVAGVPVGVVLGRYRFREDLAQGEHGSCMVGSKTGTHRITPEQVLLAIVCMWRVGFALNSSGVAVPGRRHAWGREPPSRSVDAALRGHRRAPSGPRSLAMDVGYRLRATVSRECNSHQIVHPAMVERATPMAAKDKLAALLRAADIEIDGSDPWDIRVHDDRFYARVLAHGSLGAGESYMDGWWEVASLDEFFTRLVRAKLERRIMTAAMLAQVSSRSPRR